MNPRSKLGEMVRLYCAAKGISERDAAREAGMNIATFHRVMHGHDVNLSNFLLLLKWLVVTA